MEMGKDNLKTIWKRLIDFYQPRPVPSEAFYIKWRAKMQVYDLSDVEETADHIEEHKSRPGLFPALSEFMAVADSIQSNRLSREAIKQKEVEKRGSEKFYKDTIKQDYGRPIRMLLAGCTRQEFLAEIKAHGWDTGEMERFYTSRNLDLSGLCRREL